MALWDTVIGDTTSPIVSGMTIGSGGLIDFTSKIKGITDFIIKVPLIATAAASTDITVSLPVGGCLLNATVYTTVAYAGSSTVTLALGLSAGDASYCTATTIKAIGLFPLTLLQAGAAGPGIMPTGSPNLWCRIAQAGTPSATGTAFLVLNYTAQ
jgi:hypothetical protein